jgi:hypothetical protein
MHPFTYVSTYVMAECNLRKNTTYSPFFTAKILKINKIITSIPDRQLVRACHRRLPRGSRRRRQGPIKKTSIRMKTIFYPRILDK